MFPSPASYLLAPLTPTAFSPESLFVLSSPPLLGDMKLVQVELEQRSLRGDLLDVLHTRISRKRRGMKPHKPQKQEFDNLFKAQETKEEEKKRSEWKSKVEESFYLDILILPRKKPPPGKHDEVKAMERKYSLCYCVQRGNYECKNSTIIIQGIGVDEAVEFNTEGLSWYNSSVGVGSYFQVDLNQKVIYPNKMWAGCKSLLL